MSYVIALYYWLLSLSGAPVQPCAIAPSASNGHVCVTETAPPPAKAPPAGRNSTPRRHVVLHPQISNGL